MDHQFIQVGDFSQIETAVRDHLATLPTATDSFHEEHILTATHYQIVVAGAVAGFASIRKEEVISQFVLSETYRHLGQSLFARLRRLEHVQAALVPTNDEFFLAHALDDYRLLAKQACFFAVADARVPEVAAGFTLRVATSDDIALVQHEAGDFFDPVERFITGNQLFITEREGEPWGSV